MMHPYLAAKDILSRTGIQRQMEQELYISLIRKWPT